MISMDSFENADGSINWSAYNLAKRNAGEICYQCDSHILFPKGRSSLCYQCASLLKKEEIHHDTFIRCPKCLDVWSPREGDNYEVFQEGEHIVTCHHCDHEFEISTHVSFSFTSPPLVDKNV